jgi:hypothetical protein
MFMALEGREIMAFEPTPAVLAVLVLLSMAGEVAAQPVAGVAAHHGAKAKPHTEAPANSGAMHVDDWFSYGAPKEAEIEREAPGVQIKVHDPHEDDIIIYGNRQRRDFEGTAPIPNLTAPQHLDAAQSVVPAMGDTCSYKSGCFDMSQPTLRSDLFGGN